MLCSCADKAPIPPKDMKAIVYELFLVDKYIEYMPELRIQADTTNVYKPVIEKFGYTVEDFYNSLYFYVRRPDDFSKIVKDVQARMVKEKDLLQARMDADTLALPDIVEGREKEDIDWRVDDDADKKLKQRRELKPEPMQSVEPAQPEQNKAREGKKKRLTKEQLKEIEERMK